MKGQKELQMIRIMAATHCKLHLLFLLYQRWDLSPKEYPMAALMISRLQVDRLEKMNKEGMQIIQETAFSCNLEN